MDDVLKSMRTMVKAYSDRVCRNLKDYSLYLHFISVVSREAKRGRFDPGPLQLIHCHNYVSLLGNRFCAIHLTYPTSYPIYDTAMK